MDEREGEALRADATVVSADKPLPVAEAEVQKPATPLDVQRLESVGLLAGGIADDLNHVLMPIVMAAAVLDEQISDPAARRVLSILNDAAERGNTMVQQIIEFARLAQRPDPVVTNPRRLLEDLRRLLAETFQRSIDLTIEVGADVPNIAVEPTKVQQVLLNLCANARDAMPAGGVLIIRAATTDVDESMAARITDGRPGQYVVLSVTDNGCGIAPNLGDRIFRPFFTTKPNGRGLGLSTARDFTRAYGGFITLSSEPERGTTARVFLPVSSAPELEHPLGDLPVRRGGGELLLVVEDESSLRLMMAEVLSGYGYRVMTAADGTEAVAMFGRHPDQIRLVLVDLMMPLMDGAFGVSALRTIDPNVKLIAVTGTDSPGLGIDALQFSAVLRKPVRIADLLTVVRGVLDR